MYLEQLEKLYSLQLFTFNFMSYLHPSMDICFLSTGKKNSLWKDKIIIAEIAVKPDFINAGEVKWKLNESTLIDASIAFEHHTRMFGLRNIVQMHLGQENNLLFYFQKAFPMAYI